MECIAAAPALKKHRDRQRYSRGFFVILSICHLAIGIWLAVEKCEFGWHIIGFTLFGVLLIREKALSQSFRILWGQQLLLLIMTIHALWHFNESSPQALRVALDRWKPPMHIPGKGLSLTSSLELEEETDSEFLAEQVAKNHQEELNQKLIDEVNSFHDGSDHMEKKKSYDLPSSTHGHRQLSKEDLREKVEQLRKKENIEFGGINKNEGQHDIGQKLTHEEKAEDGRGSGFFSNIFNKMGSSHKFGKEDGGGGGPPEPGADIPLGFRDDLATWTVEQVMRAHRQLFQDMPQDGFLDGYKNPCWNAASSLGQGRSLLSQDVGYFEYDDGEEEEEGEEGKTLFFHESRSEDINVGLLANETLLNHRRSLLKRPSSHRFAKHPPRHGQPINVEHNLECLPYAYLLGMPKCGSSDLWERLVRHREILAADRKEVRFFTPGEFSAKSPERGFMPPEKSLSDFTLHHAIASDLMYQDHTSKGESKGIIVDGGPHTLWWSIQDPSGRSPPLVQDTNMPITPRHHFEHKFGHRLNEEGEGQSGGVSPAPIHYLLYLLQPKAKFLITLAEPVRRMYSDYYFLTKSGVAMGTQAEGKSPDEFHDIAVSQVNLMHTCFVEQSGGIFGTKEDYLSNMEKLPIEAEQACAYDRAHFGRPGTGRIAIGMYHAFIHKWLQVYHRSQFKVVRLEDFNESPQAHLKGVFDWLGVAQLTELEWERVLIDRTFNEHRTARSPMREDSENILREFYSPFNTRLSELLKPGGSRNLKNWPPESDPLSQKIGRDDTLSIDKNKHAINRYGGGVADSSLEQSEEGDEDADKFLWQDTWELRNADKPVMKSKWDASSPGRSPPLHAVRGVMSGDIGARNTGTGVLDDGLHELHENEEFGTESREYPQRLRAGGSGAPRRRARASPMLAAGRNGLVNIPHDLLIRNEGATAVCLASMGLHLEALDMFLNTPGVTARGIMKDDRGRNSLHCLSAIWIFGDSLRESVLTHLLGGKNTEDREDHWIEQVMNPPFKHGEASYSIYHITNGTREIAAQIATILLEHGADPSHQDDDGRSPLYFAAIGGLDSVVEVLLKYGSNVNLTEDRYEQTPLHVCATHGHANIAKMLISAGADPYLKDLNGNSFHDMATAVGSAISPTDLKTYLGWDKKPQKLLSGESAYAMFKKYGNGGWRSDSLGQPYAAQDYDHDPHCGVDMLNASLITPEEIVNKYINMNRPVLIRGLSTDSPAWSAYTAVNLKANHGSLPMHISDIPYNQKFGSPNGMDESLGDYIDEMVSQGGSASYDHPWYAFKGHPVGRMDTAPESLVGLDTMTIPKIMGDIFERYRHKGRPKRPHEDSGFLSGLLGGGGEQPGDKTQRDYRSAFVNMQWALGTKGSGAPVHFHNVAWNQLFYGRKHWYILPPRTSMMGKKQVLDWVENDVAKLEQEGFHMMQCTQQQGDALIIPEMWGHAVLNTQDSIAVASELAQNIYRLPLPKAYKDLSNLGESSRATPSRD